MSLIGDRMAEFGIDPQEDSPQFSCFGNACRGCTHFFYCPMHWGTEE